MAVNPKKLIRNTVIIPVEGDTVTIHLNRPSLAALDEIRAALKSAGKEEDQTLATQVEFHLFPNILSWDMVQDKLDEDGNPVLDKNGEPVTEPFPLTVENLLHNVPAEISMEMLAGVSLSNKKDTDAGNAPLTP